MPTPTKRELTTCDVLFREGFSLMMQRMGDVAKTQALGPRERWALVAERLREESRAATYEDKLEQLASLVGSVDDFGWREKLAADDERVRAIWMKLRQTSSHG